MECLAQRNALVFACFSVLVNLYMYDVPSPLGNSRWSPRRGHFLNEVLPKLEILQRISTTIGKFTNHVNRVMTLWSVGTVQSFLPFLAEGATKSSSSTDSPQVIKTSASGADEIHLEVMDTSEDQNTPSSEKRNDVTVGNHKDGLNGENGERKAAIRVCKTGKSANDSPDPNTSGCFQSVEYRVCLSLSWCYLRKFTSTLHYCSDEMDAGVHRPNASLHTNRNLQNGSDCEYHMKATCDKCSTTVNQP